MSVLSIVRAPTVNVSSAGASITNTISSAVSSPSISVGVTTPQFLVPNAAPNLSLSAISTPQINITSAITSPSSLNLSGIGSTLGVPTSAGGIASSLNLSSPTLPSTGQAINTLSQGLGINLPGGANLNSLSQAFSGTVSSLIPAGSLSLTGLQLPKIPPFPGIDLAGINLGAGPKFIAEQIAKFKTLVPPFVPGLKINMGMALAAISILRAAMSANPSELVKHLLDGVVSDLKNQVAGQLQSALDSTGVSGIQNQINGVQSQVNGVIGGAQDSFLSNFNRENPPQTITNDDGEIVEIPAPKPDLSQFQPVSILPPQGTGILQSTSNQVQGASSNVLSQAKAFTFPPKG
jgi:hypothetical protein